MEITLTNENFEEEVVNSDVPVLVDFWAVWCMLCKMLAAIVEELANEANGAYKVGKVNVDEAPELAACLLYTSILNPNVFIYTSPLLFCFCSF